MKSVPVEMLNAVLDPVRLIELDEEMMRASPVEMLKFMFGPLMELDDDMAKFSVVKKFKLPDAITELFSIRISRACTVIASDV